MADPIIPKPINPIFDGIGLPSFINFLGEGARGPDPPPAST